MVKTNMYSLWVPSLQLVGTFVLTIRLNFFSVAMLNSGSYVGKRHIRPIPRTNRKVKTAEVE